MYIKKLVLILFLILSIFLGTQRTYAQVKNAGFVPRNIWYSTDSFEEGDNIKIYTFIFNPDKRELSGKVAFYDKDILLGKKDFIIKAQSAEDLYINWKVTIGDHSIFAKIENTKFLISKDKYEEVNLTENETPKNLHTVNKKIILKNNEKNKISVSSNQKENISDFNILKSINTKIKENTPEIVRKSTINTVSAIEDFRSSSNTTLKSKKETIKKEIESLKKEEVNKTENNSFLKPFKYVELFFFTILSFIFEYKIIFYILGIVLIFLILRYIWRKIF